MITMSQLMKIIKPVRTAKLIDVCAAFLTDIKETKAGGETHYEIASRYTRNNTPFVINFN